MSAKIVRYITQPDVKQQFLNAGAEVVANSPEQFAAFVKTDTAKWSKLVKDAGIKIE